MSGDAMRPVSDTPEAASDPVASTRDTEVTDPAATRPEIRALPFVTLPDADGAPGLTFWPQATASSATPINEYGKCFRISNASGRGRRGLPRGSGRSRAEGGDPSADAG
ncbi:MAG: hypothetical protein AB7O32_20930, partial [Vicinamibacterales bacterium]